MPQCKAGQKVVGQTCHECAHCEGSSCLNPCDDDCCDENEKCETETKLSGERIRNIQTVSKKCVSKDGSSTSSSGGDCVVCTQAVPQCKAGQKVIGQSCHECAHCEDDGLSGGVHDLLNQFTDEYRNSIPANNDSPAPASLEPNTVGTFDSKTNTNEKKCNGKVCEEGQECREFPKEGHGITRGEKRCVSIMKDAESNANSNQHESSTTSTTEQPEKDSSSKGASVSPSQGSETGQQIAPSDLTKQKEGTQVPRTGQEEGTRVPGIGQVEGTRVQGIGQPEGASVSPSQDFATGQQTAPSAPTTPSGEQQAVSGNAGFPTSTGGQQATTPSAALPSEQQQIAPVATPPSEQQQIAPVATPPSLQQQIAPVTTPPSLQQQVAPANLAIPGF